MLDSLFGAEMPLAVRFFLAFLIVLGLIGATAWAVRRFGTGRLGGANTRGRQPRLAVIDYASVDGRRRLILVRRDNVEHLLMIGGPTDVVVEPNIVRAVAAPRDVPSTRPNAGLDTLPRAIPLPENGNGSWPLAPEPTGGPRPTARIEPPLADELPRPHAEPPARPQRDTLAALADELSVRPTPPRRPVSRPLTDEPQQDFDAKSDARSDAARPDIKPETKPETKPDLPLPPLRKPMSQPIGSQPIGQPAIGPFGAPAVPPSAPAAVAPAATTADQSLADMAQRLEAALQKAPPAEPRPAAPTSRPPLGERPITEPRPRLGDSKPARPDAKPGQGQQGQGKGSLYDSLEQEMASLLGRPTKT
jgi:flagellar protein FliO/FliZ